MNASWMWRGAVAAVLIAAVEASVIKEVEADAGPLMKAGFAERDITPALGMEQPGGYGKAFHRSLHDPCKVRAAVFGEGESRVALVGVDTLIVRRGLVQAARAGIEKQCGIRPQAVLIGASHSHSSGPLGMILPGEFDHASPLVQKLAYEKSSCADAGYMTTVEKQIIDAVCAADKARGDVRCGIDVGLEERAAYNRRFRMKNGLSFTHPGKGNPDIIEPAGPIDPQVGVLGAFDAKGNLVGCVVNYACHATTNPGGISANWIYYLERTIRGTFGPDVVVVFLQGACGDVTQVDNLSPSANPGPEAWCRLVGGRVGAEAVKVLTTMQPGVLAPLAACNKTIPINRRRPAPERLKKCLELVQQEPKQVGVTDWTFAKEIVLLDAIIAHEPVVPVEVQAVQIGPAVFLTNPAEFFCQLGLDIKRGSPFKFTFPVELANDCVGYVPTAEALGPHGGGYETRLTSYTNLEPTAGTQMVKACLDLARQLQPGQVPEPPKAPPFREPWSYGSVSPELK